jgi:hypothetical protein
MKTLHIWVLGAVVALGLSYNAKANTITDLGMFTITPNGQDPPNIQNNANANGVDTGGGTPDDMDLTIIRLTGNGTGGTTITSFGTFILTVDNTTNTQTLTFTMNPGFVLAGASVHAGGGQTVEFFSINDETSGTNEGPFFGPGGPTNGKGLSNFDVFVEEGGAAVPDGGSTVMLLGAALGSVEVLRRLLLRKR